MKKIADITGYAAALAIMVAAVLKFGHFPGAGAALTFTGLLLGIYFPVYIIDKMGEATAERILPLHIAAALSASFTELGITFRLQHWAGAGILLTIGLAGFSLVFLPMLLVQRSKPANANNITNSAGAMGLAAFALGTLFKLQHLPGAAILLAAGPIFIFLVYFPMYLMNKSVDERVKRKHLRDSFFVIVIGALLALYFVKSIEIHDSINDAKQGNEMTNATP